MLAFLNRKRHDDYKEELDKVQKKLKSLRKKLRDIEELQVKLNAPVSGTNAVLSKEQKEKLSRKQEVELFAIM